MYEEADSTKLRKKKKKKKAKCFLDITGKQNFHTITTSFFSFVCVDGLFFWGVGDWQSVKLMDSQSSGSYTIMFICKRNKRN